MTAMKRPANMSRIRSFFERWERLETSRRELSDDLKELFSEAKSEGFNSKALRVAFAEKFRVENEPSAKAEKREMDEADADLYLAALAGPSHACEASQSYAEVKGRDDVGNTDAIPHDPETGEITEQEQPETQSSVESRERQTVGVQAQGSVDSPISKPEATPMDEARKGPSGTAAGITPSAVPAVEPEAAPPSPLPASGEVSDADVPAFLRKDRKEPADYRPHCLRPEACGSSGLHHCYQCQKAIDAAAESEAA